MEVPAEVYDVQCPACGAPATPADNPLPIPHPVTAEAIIHLVCSTPCGRWYGAGWTLRATQAEYEAAHGPAPMTVLLAGDDPNQPLPLSRRPPEAAALPEAAWTQACANTIRGRHSSGDHPCGAILVPDLDRLTPDEFRSVIVVRFTCRVCPGQVWPSPPELDVPLSEEEHLQMFGRTRDAYRPPLPDPADYDEGDVPGPTEYSIWRTADRTGLLDFPTLGELVASEDHDFTAMDEGEYTIKHWPTGTEFDGAEFAVAHAGTIRETYTAQGYDLGFDPDCPVGMRYDAETGDYVPLEG
jgi:hypothetical protein